MLLTFFGLMRVTIVHVVLVAFILGIYSMAGCSEGGGPPVFAFEIDVKKDDAEKFLLDVNRLAEALELELRDASVAVSRLEEEETVFRFYKSSQVMLEVNNLLTRGKGYRLSFYINSEREFRRECEFLIEAQHYMKSYIDFSVYKKKIEMCLMCS